jgi:hypothetical protein
VQWAKERGAALVIENLKFLHAKDVSAKFNWVTHQCTYRAFLTALDGSVSATRFTHTKEPNHTIPAVVTWERRGGASESGAG